MSSGDSPIEETNSQFLLCRFDGCMWSARFQLGQLKQAREAREAHERTCPFRFHSV